MRHALNLTFALLIISLAAAPQGTKPQAYPDTPEGLRDLMLDIVEATSKQHPSRDTLVASLVLPEDSSWFQDTFGHEKGASLSKAYRDSLAAFDRYMQGLFRHCASEGLREIQVERVDEGPAAARGIGGRVASHMKQRVPLYRVSFRKGGRELASSQNYVFSEGGFRHISDGVFAVLPTVPQPRMRLAESAALRMLVHRVEPILPEGAADISDRRVILRVVTDNEGNVKDVTTKQGHPVLARAAMEAVRQWRFQPPQPQGYPHLRMIIETEITIRF